MATSAALLALRDTGKDSTTLAVTPPSLDASSSQDTKDKQESVKLSPASEPIADAQEMEYPEEGEPVEVADSIQEAEEELVAAQGSVNAEGQRAKKRFKGGVVGGVPGGVVGGVVGGVAAGLTGPAPGGTRQAARRLSPGDPRNLGQPRPGAGGTGFERSLIPITETRFSTIATDVDTASYARLRQQIRDEGSVEQDGIRVEEHINYFDYQRPRPKKGRHVAMTSEMGPAPWNASRQLLRVAVSAQALQRAEQPKRNLVFLIDVSGSMAGPTGLRLIRYGLSELVGTLNHYDRVSIVVYAGASGEVLAPTSGDQKKKILSALSQLEAGGSTNGGAGIELAYRRAKENFVEGGINRVILATDGDFNVGVTEVDDLITMVEKQRDSGIYLSVLGVDGWAWSDHRMEQMADHGNGNYAYLDSEQEAKRVLLHEVNETLNAVADDVKIQVEFNPERVKAHRVIGYDNRQLAKRDFTDDKKDAGDMGDGQLVTALYELELQPDHKKHAKTPFAKLSTRYRPFGETRPVMFHRRQENHQKALDHTSDDFRFAASVAQFGSVLKQRDATLDQLSQVHRIALSARGSDRNCKRAEFVNLVREYTIQHDPSGQSKNWTKVRCKSQPFKVEYYDESKRESFFFSPGSRPQSRSLLSICASALEYLAELLRTLPAWASWIPAGIGLGVWLDELIARRRRGL